MSSRLRQIDGLRGAAALAVVAYHYTTRFDERFAHTEDLPLRVPLGHLGVELFFVISGFVIFMTLDRVRTAADFVVSRFVRLFPTYWVAVIITWCVTTWVALPGTTRTWRDLLLNVTMLGPPLGARPIDGVYWSLEVELYFYGWMLLAAALGLTQRGLGWLHVWLALSAGSALSAATGGPQLPYVVHQICLMNWIGWFALGIVAFVWKRDGRLSSASGLALALALLAIALRSGMGAMAFSLACFGAVVAAGQGRLPGADSRMLVWLGALSYPLYLIHQEVGMVLMVLLQSAGWSVLASIAAASVTALALALALHRGVERPCGRWLHAAWLRRSGVDGQAASTESAIGGAHPLPAGPVRWPHTARLTGCLLVGFAVLSQQLLAREKLTREREATQWPPLNAMPTAAPEVPCAKPGQQAMVLLTLGQSNAASQAQAGTPSPPVKVLDGSACRLLSDPLPNTTGSQASVWSALATELDRRLPQSSTVLVPLGIGASTIRHWTEPGAVREQFLSVLRSLRDNAVQPAFVLWQQGEADMREGTEAHHYAAALVVLRSDLDAHGIRAPLLVARSTYCRQAGSGAIARALEHRLEEAPIAGIWRGPDTDRLGNDHRYDRCHFNALGRDAAAMAWADVIVQHVANQHPAASEPRP